MSKDAEDQELRPQMIFHRDRAEYWAFVAQIVSAAAVVVSLVFVGIQLRAGNSVALRDESNATMAQWSSFRTSIYADRETAKLFMDGMNGYDPDDADDQVDQLRFLYLMREHGWATFQIWERAQGGLIDPVHFSTGAGPDFLRVICTPGGANAWAQIKSEFPQAYVAALDQLGPRFAQAHKVRCLP